MLDHQLALIHFLNGMNGLKMDKLLPKLKHPFVAVKRVRGRFKVVHTHGM